MVLVSFDDRGIIFTNFVPKGNTVNIAYIKEALASFLKVFCIKSPIMAVQD